MPASSRRLQSTVMGRSVSLSLLPTDWEIKFRRTVTETSRHRVMHTGDALVSSKPPS